MNLPGRLMQLAAATNQFLRKRSDTPEQTECRMDDFQVVRSLTSNELLSGPRNKATNLMTSLILLDQRHSYHATRYGDYSRSKNSGWLSSRWAT